MIAAWLAGVPVRIAEEIGIPHQHYLAKKIFKYIYVLSDAVIANATLVLDYLREQNQVKQRKIRLVYNPVLFKNEMETGKRTKDLFTIVSISRLTPIKNIEKLIGIFPRLLKHFPQIRYNIVGDGPSRKALTKQVQELGLENYVTFKGFQSNITSFLEEADLYVLPSFSEGFPNALVEAMYNGLPCVATKIGGASEIIEDGTNGYLIDPHDSGHIYTILERMILMPEDELAAMGQRAKQHVLDSYSLERHMESLFSIYKMYLNS
jgi:glycosyltransferase involved in cell wall biosynthesis